MIKEYFYEKKPDDSGIYYKICQYQVLGNAYVEERWWAHLAAISDRKKQNLKCILNRPEYRAAFDLQLDVLRLGGGMKLMSVPRSRKTHRTGKYEGYFDFKRL